MRLSKSLLGAAAASALLSSTANAQGLAEVGPLNPDNGFPEWYEDNNGLRLGQCLNQTGLCLVENLFEITNPGQPFPDNYGGTFAGEFFWWAGEADITGPGGETALLVMAMEGAFANEVVAAGDQVTFARVRIRVTGLIPGATYTVTTPVGNFVFVAEDAVRNINFTEDIGFAPGVFTGALGGSIGPFLTWDSDLPVTDGLGNEYVGNPALPHTITGSPFGTNLFRVQGPGLNMQTDLFSIMGLVVPVVVPEAPVADFNSAPNSGTAPLNVAFTDTSTGVITSWAWDFGDASGSALQNPSHVYGQGTFTVSLTVTGPGGTSILTKPALIAVAAEPPPPANLLVLANPVPGTAGVANTLVVTGCTPGRTVGVYTGLNLGASIVNQGGCGGIPIGLNRPFRLAGKANANAAGIATIVTTPPNGSAGRTFHFQAVEPASCRTSNVVSDQL